MRLLLCIFLIATLAIPAAAQIAEELKREEIGRFALFQRIVNIDNKLKAADAAGASADLEKLAADLAVASFPGEEIRRRITAARSVLAQGDLRGTNAVFRQLILDNVSDAELSRPDMGAQLRLLGRSLAGDTVPPTMTAAIEQAGRGIENYPSYYATWTRRQMESLHFACATRNLPLARDLVLKLVRGVAQGASDLEWRDLVEQEWTRQIPDEAERPALVLAALKAIPNTDGVPPGSPYDHWIRVHQSVLVALMERGTDAQRRIARDEWVLSNTHVRDF